MSLCSASQRGQGIPHGTRSHPPPHRRKVGNLIDQQGVKEEVKQLVGSLGIGARHLDKAEVIAALEDRGVVDQLVKAVGKVRLVDDSASTPTATAADAAAASASAAALAR